MFRYYLTCGPRMNNGYLKRYLRSLPRKNAHNQSGGPAMLVLARRARVAASYQRLDLYIAVPFSSVQPGRPSFPFRCSLPTAKPSFSWNHSPLSSPPPHRGGSDGVFPGPTPTPLFDSAGLAPRLGPRSPKTSVWTARHSLVRNARGVAARRAGGAMSGVTRPGPSAIPAARQAWAVMASQPTCDGRRPRARQPIPPRAPLVLHQAPLSGREDTYIRVMLLPVYISSPLFGP